MKKVITYGTFDLFHKGHYNILKRAKEAGDYLIVGVTGESYDVERGKLSVQDSLATRIENVKKTGFADQIIVEEYLGQKIPDILKYDVDILVIGSDWKGKFDHLNKYCEVQYLERTKDISSTQLREEHLDIYKFGIVTDNMDDNDAVMEPKHVSGIHVESVFCSDKAIAEEFADKYELDKGYSNYHEFLDSIDIVYIKSRLESRAEYIEEAIYAGKHVVCDSPYSLDREKECELRVLAEKRGIILLENITTLYLQAFGQLLWMARGNVVGDLISVKCSISSNKFTAEHGRELPDLAYYPLCAIMKILGNEYSSSECKMVKDNDRVVYAFVSVLYDNAIALLEMGRDLDVDGGMTIIGTEGTIIIPDNWWDIGYFKLKKHGESQFKRYSSNFEGNGFRYLMQAMLKMIKNDSKANQRITTDEAKAIMSVLHQIRDESNHA